MPILLWVKSKDVQAGVLNQATTGTTALVTPGANEFVFLVSYVFVMSLAGTVKFTDGVADLSGPMDIAANSGAVAPSGAFPWFATLARGRPLNIVTTLGAARGHFTYFLV